MGDAGSQMGLGWESVQLPNWSNNLNRVGLTSRWWSWNPGREYQEEEENFHFQYVTVLHSHFHCLIGVKTFTYELKKCGQVDL